MIQKVISAKIGNIVQYNGEIYIKVVIDDEYKWINFREATNKYDYLVESCTIEDTAKKCTKRKSKK